MITECQCHLCGGSIEFEVENDGQSFTCPHCGKLTMLTTRGKGRSVVPRLIACAHCDGMIARKALDCPHCGGPTKNKPSVFYYVFVGAVSLVITCIILGVIGFIATGVLAGMVSGKH